MSRPLGRMQSTNKRFTRAIRRDFAQAQRSVDRFGKNLNKSVGRTASRVVAGGFIAIGAGVAVATKEFIDFDTAITAASAKFGPTFQRGTEGFEQLGKAAREVGATTEFTATQAAEGLDFLALAGFNAVQSMSLLPGVVDLATASQTDLASASDIASDSLGAFGLMTKDSTALAGNFARVMDVMAKTTTTSNTDLATLFETVKKGAASFTASGQSLESFNALAGKLANAGLKGAESGTALRNVMLRLAKPTGEAAGVIKKLGVDIQDSQGNFRDVIDIIADFEKGLKGMGTAQRSAALATVFGARTVTGINLLLSEGSDSLREYRTQLQGATGAAGDMAAVMRESLGNQIATLKSAALELGFQFVESFQENGRGAIQTITEAIRNFDVKPVVEGIKTAFNIVSKFVEIVKPFAPLILSLVVAFKAYKITMIAVAVAQTLFNKSISANPIGLMVIAIWGLIKALDELEKRFGFGQKIVDEFGGGIGSEAFELGRRERLRERQAEAGLTDPRRQRLAERQEVQAPISPAERSALIREESVSRGEVTIRDESGRAEMTKKPTGPGFDLSLIQSGGF